MADVEKKVANGGVVADTEKKEANGSVLADAEKKVANGGVVAMETDEAQGAHSPVDIDQSKQNHPKAGVKKAEAPADVEMRDAADSKTDTASAKGSTKPKEPTKPSSKSKADKKQEKPYVDKTKSKSIFSFGSKSKKSKENKAKPSVAEETKTEETKTEETKADKSKTAAGGKRKADVDNDFIFEKAEEEEKEPDPHPLPDNLKFGFAPEEAFFDDHQAYITKHFRGDFDRYKRELTDLSKKKKFEKQVLLMNKDDCISAGCKFYEDEYRAFVTKYRLIILTHVDYEQIMPPLVECGVFTKEHDVKFKKTEQDKKRLMQQLLDFLPKQGQGCITKFIQCLKTAGYKDISERMYTEETKPAKLVVDYVKRKITFKKEKEMTYKELKVEPEPEPIDPTPMETSPAPAAEGTSVDKPAETDKDAENSATETSVDKPAETSADNPAETSEEKPVEVSTEKPAETPADASVDKPGETSTEKQGETSTDKSADDSADKPGETSADNTAETSTEQPAEKSADKPTDKETDSSETPADEAESAMETSTDQTTVSSDEPADRPKDDDKKSKSKAKGKVDKSAAKSKTPGDKSSDEGEKVKQLPYYKRKSFPYQIQPRSALDKDYEIEGVMVKYVWINAVCNEILVSYWTDEDRESFRNFWIKVDPYDPFGTFQLLNALRRLVYEEDEKTTHRIEAFYPLVCAYAEVRMYKDDAAFPEDQPGDEEYELKYVTFDEEGIALYDAWHHEVPEEYFMMHIEYTQNSIERIFYHGISGHVMQIDKKINEGSGRCFIDLYDAHSQSHKEMYDRIKYQLRTNITPKPKDTWNFEDKETLKKWCVYCRGYIKYDVEDHVFKVPETEHPDIPDPPSITEGIPVSKDYKFPDILGMSTDDQSKTEQSDDSEDSSDDETTKEEDAGIQRMSPPTSQPAPSRSDVMPQGSGAHGGFHGASVTDDETEALILQLQSANIEVVNQDMQMKWIMNWSETEPQIKDNLIPESGIESGGLDENSGEHFRATIKSIKQTLMEDGNEMPKALANLRGLAKVFSKSKHDVIRNWLSSLTEEQRLQQIFSVEL